MSQWDEFNKWAVRSTKLLIKKLARNDCSWADDPKNHQYGPYIPSGLKDSGFFPNLENINKDKPHIFESSVLTIWPATGEIKLSRFAHYSNKGVEMQFTGVPKTEFAGLTPASLLVGGLLRIPEEDVRYWFMIFDSASEEAELLEAAFDIGVDFHFAIFNPSDALSVDKNETDMLIKELSAALKAGTLRSFIASVAKLPPPECLAAQAQMAYLQEQSLDNLDPFLIPNPGDAIMKISRDVEFALYKQVERRHRAADVLRIVTEEADLVTAIVKGFPQLDATFLSASQHRKSRGGLSFEYHIGRMMTDGKIPFEAQKITGGRRPDFILPSLKVLSSPNRGGDEALIISAKTTLRERWKQVALEKFNCSLFLATVDDRVSSDAIDDMQKHGIHMVVPESLKTAKETCYAGKSNVISFKEFFQEEVFTKRLNFWNK